MLERKSNLFKNVRSVSIHDLTQRLFLLEAFVLSSLGVIRSVVNNACCVLSESSSHLEMVPQQSQSPFLSY